jgi:LysM repeat protein
MKNTILLAVLFISFGLFAVKSETVNHRIQPKETLFRISLMYNSTVNDIVKANPGLNPKSISAGTTIKVPKDTKVRDAEFVQSFLSDKPVIYTPISQIAKLISTEKPKTAEAAPVTTDDNAQASNENPFLTPSEPRGGPIADEMPIVDTKLVQPASADNSTMEDDENPFMSPKPKSEEPKEHK